MLLRQRLLVQILHGRVAAPEQRALRHAADCVIPRRRALLKCIHAGNQSQAAICAAAALPVQQGTGPQSMPWMPANSLALLSPCKGRACNTDSGSET